MEAPCSHPGEAAGAITKLASKDGDGAKDLVINVEYNQLAPLLLDATGEGDVNDPATGFSPYPGNANVLVLELDSYAATLDGADKGVVDEFVNPKYKDATKCAFKKPTRLECMMQDYPKLLKREVPDALVGFTTFERWIAFSPAKNALDAARDSSANGEPPGAAGSAEFEVYEAHAKKVGFAVDSAPRVSLGGVAGLYGGPKVVLLPSFALVQADVDAKIAPGALTLSDDSVLVLEGENVKIDSASVHGALKISNTRADATLLVKDLTVANDGLAFVEIPDDDLQNAKPFERIRGYEAVERTVLTVTVDEPGHFLLSGDGVLTKLNDKPEL